MIYKVLGGILLGTGILALLISVYMFVTADSSLSTVLLVLSMLVNVAGIMLLSYSPRKKKK